MASAVENKRLREKKVVGQMIATAFTTPLPDSCVPSARR